MAGAATGTGGAAEAARVERALRVRRRMKAAAAANMVKVLISRVNGWAQLKL